MTDEEHSCLLRRLTLCDGHAVVTDPPRTHECYCTIVDRGAEIDGQALVVMMARTERARTVARSDEIQRRAEQRRRWEQLGDRW